MLSYLKYPIEILLELIAPRLCAACRAVALPAPCAFCQSCLEQSQIISGEAEGSWALVVFAGPAQRAVHRAKYESDDLAASSIGVMLGANLPRDFSSFDCVVPIPVGAKRLRERGFDQAALIAREVARALGVSFLPTGLRRQKETSALARLAREERRDAIAGAFFVDRRLSNKRVIVIDDVVTSGATSEEAKAALIQAGAREVAVVCFAKTLKRSGSDRAGHVKVSEDPPRLPVLDR
jgi:ComF family protein